MSDLILSVLALVGFALVIGAIVIWRHKGDRRRVFLMILAALVMFANVAIWTIPDGNGARLSDGASRAKPR